MKNKGLCDATQVHLVDPSHRDGLLPDIILMQLKSEVKVKRKSVLEEMQQEHVQVQFGLLTKEGGTTWSGSCVTHSGWKKDLRQTL